MHLKKLLLIAGLLCIGLVLSACSTLNAVGALLGNQVTFTAPELQQSLDRRFPRDYDKLGGLVSVSLMNPRLSIPPGATRLRLDFDLGIAALGGNSRTPDGRFTLTSALRYDPATRGLHLMEPSIERVDIPSLGGVMNDTARGALNRWLVDYAREEPVYRFDDSLIGRLGSRRIAETRIEQGQVVVHLGN
ncbi:DUF1439 domain-containing protein [Lysobacter korlensis]|uniref:DUF1439 domain-containing protein n=1 Tax=Lysobacter korlensis TaxID=553636 RepID=A0ABV6RQZ7_9GAMM